MSGEATLGRPDRDVRCTAHAETNNACGVLLSHAPFHVKSPLLATSCSQVPFAANCTLYLRAFLKNLIFSYLKLTSWI